MVTREFLAERKTGIGGVSKWSSPLQVWASKVRALDEDVRLEEIDMDAAEQLRWGQLVEPLVIGEFGRKTGREVIHGELFFRHPEIRWLIGHADGEQSRWPGDKSLIECKNVSQWIWMEWLEDAPLPVKVQTQHYLAASGRDMATATALIGGNKLVWHDIERNQPFIDAMLEEEERFWARVVSDNPPTATAKDCKFLNTLTPENPKVFIQLPGDALACHDELVTTKGEIKELKEEMKTLEEKRDELEAKIKQQMGEASGASLPDGSMYMFKTTIRKPYTVKGCEYRTLRLKKAKR